jgi:hypothetical protein
MKAPETTCPQHILQRISVFADSPVALIPHLMLWYPNAATMKQCNGLLLNTIEKAATTKINKVRAIPAIILLHHPTEHPTATAHHRIGVLNILHGSVRPCPGEMRASDQGTNANHDSNSSERRRRKTRREAQMKKRQTNLVKKAANK